MMEEVCELKCFTSLSERYRTV